tara:strand:- start:1108 stop:1398 length:291 start_codon:yes stop_codon:yes gene_type:complete
MAKKKIKKALMMAAPIAAIAAMMGKKGKAFTNADARKLMTSNAAMRNSMMNNPFGGMMKTGDMANDPMFLNAMKKGGRVKKGFAKKKKQANKMRKK